jgi:TrmH family RNA methyltransferase
MTISKGKIKLITSLKQKKAREEHKLFVIEGEKIVSELIKSGFEIIYILALPIWIKNYESQLRDIKCEVFEINDNDLQRISSLKTPNQVLAVIKQPENILNIANLRQKITLFLDDIQDPGNLGTIIRVADWFGIENIICSDKTVDVFNPKVVQSTMGALLRVKVFYLKATLFFDEITRYNIPVYGAYLNGKNIYTTDLSQEAIIVMGNESNGINKELLSYITQAITIPSGSMAGSGTESLNVSVATSIICAEFTRKLFYT